MTQFDLSKFDMGYGRERYVTYEGKFIGRFKHANATACAKHFVKFLVANFTVEEFFAGLEQKHERVNRTLAPAEVLETKGFIDYNTRRSMKRGGYTTVREMLDAMMAAHDKARAEQGVTTLVRA